MSEWKEYTIEDICEQIFAGGDAAKYRTTKHQTSLYNIPVYANSTEDDGLYGYCDKAVVSSPAVTIAARGAGIGFVAFRNKPFVPIVRLITLITNNSVETKFLYYYLKNRRLSGDGSAIPQITVPMVKKETVIVPILKEQKRIVNILSSLDEKIETNRKINARLEELAQALFKSWFIDFEPFGGKMPADWETCTLGDLTVECKNRVRNRKDVKVLSPISSGELVLSDEYFSKQVYSKELSKYIIVAPNAFAYNPARVNIGSIGKNNFKFDGCVSPVYVVFRAIDGYEEFINQFIKTKLFKDEVLLRAIGGVRQTLDYHDFSLIEFNKPNIDVVTHYTNIVNPLYIKMGALNTESARLAALRDTLLPKLMSGEIKPE